MQETISDFGLVYYLENLRKLLKNFNILDAMNIIFINIDAFYAFISERTASVNHEKSFRELMNKVEPFIPLTITETNFNKFLEAVVKNDLPELEYLEQGFINSSRIKFINSICNLKTEEEWDDIINACLLVRSYKSDSDVIISNR